MPEVWLVRHGETEWSRDHRHTSVTDVPLTEAARGLAPELAPQSFRVVLTSPRSRTRTPASLAGCPDAEVDEDLVEWAYGDYEGVTTEEIRRTVPVTDGRLFRLDAAAVSVLGYERETPVILRWNAG